MARKENEYRYISKRTKTSISPRSAPFSHTHICFGLVVFKP